MNGAADPADTDDLLDGEDPLEPITEEQVKAILAAEISDARQMVESSIVADRRRRNLQYYNAEPFGGGLEIEGRSQNVIDDVRNAIEWIMPSLMRMYTGGSRL